LTDPRIAVVYDCLFPLSAGGGERVYRRLSELMAARGNSVTYVTRVLWDSAPPPPDEFVVQGVWKGEIYDPRGNRTTASALAFALAVYRHLRGARADYDIVVASALPVLTLIAARLALRGSSAWLVGDWLEVWTWRQWRGYAGLVSGTIAYVLQGIGARSADLDTVNSGFTAKRLARYSKRREPLVLGLVDLAGEPHPSAVSAPPYLLFVGRLIPDKRVTALPSALAVARKTHPDLRLVVVGVGPEAEALRAELERTGMTEGSELVGRVDDDRLSALLGGASALVNPSAREGFGLVVAEAAASSTPSVVVAGADNAAVELVEDGVNGFIARSVGAADLGAAIVSVLAGGAALRLSTAEWYARERVARGLDRSVDAILERYSLDQASRAR
jgi:glycosyltransferase involved in cell wall biosynthesis